MDQGFQVTALHEGVTFSASHSATFLPSCKTAVFQRLMLTVVSENNFHCPVWSSIPKTLVHRSTEYLNHSHEKAYGGPTLRSTVSTDHLSRCYFPPYGGQRGILAPFTTPATRGTGGRRRARWVAPPYAPRGGPIKTTVMGISALSGPNCAIYAPLTARSGAGHAGLRRRW